MLIKLTFSNFRSFFDKTEFSMQASVGDELKEINTFTADAKLFPKGENELLKSAVIFGGNASGKTNVVRVLAYMVNAIQFSASPQLNIVERNEYFAFLKGAENQDSFYEVEIIEKGIFYKYGFIINNKKIVKEWLYRREERLTKIFERDSDKIDIIGIGKQAANLIKISNTSLFLSVGNNFNLNISEYLADVVNWFKKLLIVMENSANALEIYSMESGKYKTQALDILALADIGIKKIEVIKNKLASLNNINDILDLNAQIQIDPKNVILQLKQEKDNIYNIDLQTTFDVYNDKGKRTDEKSVMLFKDSHFNSEGTNRLLCYLGWILAALDQGRVIVIDELDSKLHFLVSDFIIKLFNSIDKNPKNAQLICTAHNVMLMDEDLRRDQIYFTSKNQFGKSQLSSLIDYKNVRKKDLFSKKYLAGFYADLPDMTVKG